MYFPVQRQVPDVVFWLEWCLYAYWPSLLIAIAIAMLHYSSTLPDHYPWYAAISTTPALIGASWWVIACAMRNGYAVG